VAYMGVLSRARDIRGNVGSSCHCWCTAAVASENMAYASWRKDGEEVTPARVVGLALEKLCKAEVDEDLSCVTADSCASVELWNGERFEKGRWVKRRTRRVPVLPVHQKLALYICHRLYLLLHTLGLAVADAVRSKSRAEGSGHHDLVLKHSSAQRYCGGFISAQLKTGQVDRDGTAFENFWRKLKDDTEDSFERVLSLRSTSFGAGLLIFVGVCDSADMSAVEPPLLWRAQLFLPLASGGASWGKCVVDKASLAAGSPSPPAKRRRRCPSWDEVRVAVQSHVCAFGGTEFVPTARLFEVLRSSCKSPGQRLEFFQKSLGLRSGRDFVRRRAATTKARGAVPYWVTWDAARKIAHYECPP